jgi:hypothetical protein
MEMFCGSKIGCRPLRRLKVFGCPACVLDPRLQDGKKTPKWEPRSRKGQFLGFSREHASTVGLIRDIRTSHILSATKSSPLSLLTTRSTSWKLGSISFSTRARFVWMITLKLRRVLCPFWTPIVRHLTKIPVQTLSPLFRCTNHQSIH